MKNLNKRTILTSAAILGLAISGAHAAEIDAGIGLNANSASKGAVENTQSILQGGNAADANIEAGTHSEAEINSSVEAEADVDAGTKTAVEPAAGTAGNIDTQTMTEFKKYDSDRDGSISESEFVASVDADTSASSFAELDKNDDGRLSMAEFDALADVDVDAAINSTTTVK